MSMSAPALLGVPFVPPLCECAGVATPQQVYASFCASSPTFYAVVPGLELVSYVLTHDLRSSPAHTQTKAMAILGATAAFCTSSRAAQGYR